MRKWICTTLVVLAALCCLGGCTKTEPVQTEDVLTSVYRMEPALFPDGYMVAGYDGVTESENLCYIPPNGELVFAEKDE